MTTFRTTYSNGKKSDTESSDCDTVEAFCNTHFGTTHAEAQANGAAVEIIEPGTPMPEADEAKPLIDPAHDTFEEAPPAGEVLSGADVVAEVTGESQEEPAPVVKATRKAAAKKTAPAKKAKARK